jgi:hypothetical protein
MNAPALRFRIALADARFFVRELRAWFLDTFDPTDRWTLGVCGALFVAVLVCIVAGVLP